MKVGILTFHEVLNPGAFWQAYGTCEAVRKLGHEPVLINYTSPPHRVRPWRRLLNPKSYLHPLFLVNYIRKSRKFAEARNRLLPQTEWMDTHTEVARLPFDAVLIGADIVWDFRNPHLGNDPVYFGHHLNAPKVISWSASMGPCSTEDPVPDFVRDGFSQFTALSVRDEKTADFVRMVCGREARVLADPAFQLDAGLISQPRIYAEPYVAVYVIPGLVSMEFIVEVKALSKRTGLPLYAVGYRVPWADRNFPSSSPEEWVSVLEHAEYVFTGTFHGTVFSILLGKQFVVEYNDAIESKALGMMKRLGLQSRVYRKDQSIEHILSAEWDQDVVHQEVDCMRNEALEYLEQALVLTEAL